MNKTLPCKIVNLIVAAVLVLSATGAMAAADAFNRPNLGSTWVATTGTLSISNHQLVGDTGALGYLTPASNDKAASAVVFLTGTGLQYGAVAVGDIAGGNNAFVKLQEQDGTGMFEYAAFYTGNNGGGFFFALTTPVPSPAILDVSFCAGPTIATMRITSAAGVQIYTYDYGTSFGGGAGLGTYGSIRLDNFVGFQAGGNDSAGAINAKTLRTATDKTLP